MKEIKVAVLLSSGELFSPYYGGSVARWTYEVYRRTPAHVHPAIFGVPTDSEQRYALPFRTTSLWWLAKVFEHVPFARRYHENVWLATLMPQIRHFDVIHVQNRVNWPPILRHLGFRGKIVLHLHNGHLTHWTGPTLDKLAPFVDRTITCSNFIAEGFTGRSQAIARTTETIHNGVDINLFTPPKDPRQPKTVFFVGRIDDTKGVLPLVQAFEIVLARHPDAELIIGGSSGIAHHEETEYVRSISKLADRLKSERGARIHFPGYIDHDKELPRYFQQATVCVVPSVWGEAFGMVNCEAMGCGIPVIGSGRGAIPEVLGDCGIIVADPEPIPLAEAICRLLESPELQRSYSDRGRRRAVQLFDWNKIATQWTAMLLNLYGLES